MAVTIPFQQMAFPVKTSERVPLEDLQLWAQFAEVSTVPETFQVVADALFALSWELRLHETVHKFERAMQQDWPDSAATWLGLLADDLKYAAGDWKDVLLRLRRVVNGQHEYVDFQQAAFAHLQQAEQVLRQVYGYAVAFGEHYGIAVPERIQDDIQEVQHMLAHVGREAELRLVMRNGVG